MKNFQFYICLVAFTSLFAWPKWFDKWYDDYFNPEYWYVARPTVYRDSEIYLPPKIIPKIDISDLNSDFNDDSSLSWWMKLKKKWHDFKLF